MYEPFHRLTFSQTSFYVDQMRAGIKYFVTQWHKNSIRLMYQDTDFGKDVLTGVAMRAEAENIKIVLTPAHNPADTNFRAAVTRPREKKCDLIVIGTIVRDTTMIISTVKKVGWDVDLLGQAASYDTGVATAPGGVGEEFYSMTPTLYAYPDDPRLAVHDLMARYRTKYGIDMNYIGQTGVSVAQIALEVLRRAGKDLTVSSLVVAMETLTEFTDIYSNTYSFGPGQHHGSTKAFLAVVKDGRWVPVVPEPLGY